MFVFTGSKNDTCCDTVCCIDAIAVVATYLAMMFIQSVGAIAATDGFPSDMFALVSAANGLKKIG